MGQDPIHIGLLGPLEISSGGRPAELPPSRKARALLAYLVTTGRAHGRSALCDLFWDGVDDPRAGLRWALSRLRSVVDTDGHCRVVTSGDRVRFEADSAVVDLHRVRALVGDAPATAPVDAALEAAPLFRGTFLEGLDLHACHAYQAWCLGERERLRSLHVAIHTTLAARLRGEPEAALPHALARLSLDPFSEDAHVAAIHVLGDLGRVEQGLEIYERCRRMLTRRLGVAPSEALVSARRRLTAPGRPALAPAPAVDPVPPDPVSPDLATVLAELSSPGGEGGADGHVVPLVGRGVERARLAAILESAAIDAPAPVAFLSGEPGIGKSRLLAELAGDVRRAGGWVMSGMVFETEEIRPYGPWVEMLRSLPVAALGEGLRSGLAGLLEASAHPTPPGGPTDRTQLFDAVRALLARLAEARAPGLVILDDVQWLDAVSVALLHYVTRNLGTSAIAFALAGREEEIGAGSAMAGLLRSLDDRGHLRPLPLDRLSASDTAALVQAVSDALDPEPVIAASEGNPYFALALADARRDGATSTPTTVHEALDDRLDRLDPAGLALLPWAAALGRVFDVPTLVHVLERPATDVVDAIDGLERRGILRAAGPDRYDFTHSLLRSAAYRRPSEPARRAIHRAIALRLDALDRTPGQTPARVAGAVAHHAELGGLPDLSARACTEAAEESLWVSAHDEAMELAARGLAQLERLPDETRIPLEMGLLRIYSFRSMRNRRPEELEEQVRRLTGQAVEAGLREVVALGHALLMELQYQRGAFQEAGESSVRSAEAGRRSDPVTATRALAETAACLLILDQAPEDARRLATEAAGLAEEHRIDVDAVALATALLHHHDGRLDRALEAFRDVIRFGRQAKDHWWACPALTRMIMVDLDRADPDQAMARAREAEELTERMADEEEAAFARGLGAVAAAMKAPGAELGPIDDVLSRLRELDSLWKIGHVQAYAADLELVRGRTDAARERATEVLEAAQSLERPSLLAIARGLLAHCDAVDGRPEGATRQLDQAGAGRPQDRLSHRARTVLRRAREVAGR
jgi:DNA-binding SARP family transcriptional activator/tetratricopeptide (TPR) repeat protein